MVGSLLCAALLLQTPQPDAFLKFDLDTNAEVQVRINGQIVRPGVPIPVFSGDVSLSMHYHDGDGWKVKVFTIPAEAGMICTFTLTCRVHFKKWIA